MINKLSSIATALKTVTRVQLNSCLLTGGATLAVLGLALQSTASAASLSFKANDDRGSDAVGVDVFAQDVAGGIEFTLNVNDDLVNTGDLLAAYIDFSSAFDRNNITSVTGAFNSNWETNTRNIVGGNIGQKFDLGVQLTDTGSAGGLVTSKTFSVFGTGLDVTDLLSQEFAVRLQAVGSNLVTGGSGSAKQYGIAPALVDIEPPVASVPEPATILGLGLVASGMVMSRRRRNLAN
jgi:hypothetical protein